jgi:hypothetical protein
MDITIIDTARAGAKSAPALALLAALLLTAAVAAHDFWLEPQSFHPAQNETVPLQLRVGHAGDVKTLPRSPARIVKFIASGSDGAISDVPGVDGKEPAGLLRPSAPGLYVIAYESNHSRSELEAAKFESYLREVGLERIIEQRARRKTSDVMEPELYMRCAKSLIDAGKKGSSDSSSKPGEAASAASAVVTDRALGLRLELIAGKNPANLKPGDALPLTLLYEGRPVEGVLVVAKDPDQGDTVASTRSDAAGMLSLTLPRGGMWLISAVHMVPAKPDANAVWESIWASLTLEIANVEQKAG